MKNQEIAQVFNEIADLLEIKGADNPFRIRAYRRAAQNIEGLSKKIETLSIEDLVKIPGIGQDLADKIINYINSGHIEILDELKNEIPEGVFHIMSVPGIGPKTAKLLYEKFGIKDIDELARLASEHKLSTLSGVKSKTEDNILKGIQTLRKDMERKPIGRVLPIAHEIIEFLKNNAPISRIDIAGSLRRWKDTIKDIDILATSPDSNKAMDVFTGMPNVKEVLSKGATRSSIIIQEGLQVDLRIVDRKSYGSALAYFTGSKNHNIKLREMAIKKGLKINEYGIFQQEDHKRLCGDNEEDVYRILGLSYIPPELRENMGEIEASLEGSLPTLINLNDIQGDLHMHSRWSDGSHTIEDLVQAAKGQGYSYIAITDHSKGLGVAGGLTPERVLEQITEIESLNKRLSDFTILKGIEVDIKSDGSLDLPDDILKMLDIVVASIHSGFKQSRGQLTSRLISAIKNQYVSIIAHPTGRLLGERDEYDIDMEEVLQAARNNGTAFEINAYPARLDLNDIYARRAKELSLPIVISTDTHIISNMDYMKYGISIARRSWLQKNDILNTMKVWELLKRIKHNRR